MTSIKNEPIALVGLGIAIGLGTCYLIDQDFPRRALCNLFKTTRYFCEHSGPSRILVTYFTCVGIHSTASMLIQPALEAIRGS